MTFPRTKIQPPRPRPGYIERGPVEARLLDALVSRRLVLVCAPAGYGKTSLVSHAIAKLPPGQGLAWIASDAGDTLQRILECMLAALEPLDPPWRTAPEALVQRVAMSAEEERSVAAELINTLDAIDVPHGVLVIDDLHRIDDPAVFRFLDLLVERLSPRWTLALASRTDPPIALARLRAADDVAEFRQLQLQFARDEARQLVTGAGLDQALADRVFDRTQGWPAGLRIAVGAVQGGQHWSSSLERALRSGERPMFEFLMTEVLDQLPAELAEFLLRTSVLPELEASRCALVSGMPNAAAMLGDIERLGLFVDVLEGNRSLSPSLRLHDLFREALQQRLQERDPALLTELRRRAAASEDDPLRRIGLLAALGDLEDAARLALEHLPTAIVRTGPGGAAQVVARFPTAFRDRSPHLALVRGLLGWVHWDFYTMVEDFTRAERGFAERGDRDREMLARGYRATILMAVGRLAEAAEVIESIAEPLGNDARAVMLNARAWLAIDTGRFRTVAPLLVEMLGVLEREDRIDLWYHTSTPVRMPGLPGILEPLARHAQLMLRAAGDEPTPLRALGLIDQAWCALWRGDVAGSEEIRTRAEREADWTGNTGAVRHHVLTLTAFTKLAARDFPAAIAAARNRLEIASGSTPWVRYQVGVFAARIAASCGEAAMAREMLAAVEEAARAHEANGTPPHRLAEVPIRGQLAWLEGRGDEAIALWREALARGDELGVFGQHVETRFRLANALASRGDPAGAAAVLAPLDPAEMALKAIWGETPAVASSTNPDVRPDLQALTAREEEVLERIAAGDSNKVIARSLDLSLHTVKRHVANILGKLGVETRGQAAAWLASRKG